MRVHVWMACGHTPIFLFYCKDILSTSKRDIILRLHFLSPWGVAVAAKRV